MQRYEDLMNIQNILELFFEKKIKKIALPSQAERLRAMKVLKRKLSVQR